MKEKLKLIKELQDKYNDLYLGGSIALFMYKIDLGRTIENSDIDFTKRTDKNLDEIYPKKKDEFSSSDMLYNIEKDGIKIEIAISELASFKNIIYEGILYKLLPIEYILGYKMKYAISGSNKHIEDINYMLKKGEEISKKREEEKKIELIIYEELPF